ncbi:MAG: glycosyltransferase family 1 protein [Solirubrobacteraceae bacterium]
MTREIRSGRPVIVCFAGDLWDGHPHSRHHLMRRFARDYEILFIEGVPMRSIAGGDRHELRRIWRKLRSSTGLRTVAPGLHVLRPLPVPPVGRAGRLLQLTILRLQVARSCRRLGLDGPRLSWFSLPNVAPLRGRLGDRVSLFYYQDRYDAFSFVDGARLRQDVADLARGCDATICTSEDLAADLRAAGAEPLQVPHGVEFDRFSAPAQPPADLAALERPLIGCVGLIDDHMSFESIRAIAERLTSGTLVMVGGVNTDVSALRHPRIAFLGSRPYETMPAYVQAFGCCLIPFATSRLTVGVNPIKLREYLAAGRPVVSTAIPAVVPYGDVVELATEPRDFADGVMRTLAPGYDSAGAQKARRDRVAGESWDSIADTIGGVMRNLLAEAANR